MDKGPEPFSTISRTPPDSSLPGYIRLAAIVFRSFFIIALMVVTAWVSKPQFADHWLDHLNLGDVVRVTLGTAACLWMLVHLFMLPKDAQGYRTWAYLGVALTPLIVLCFIIFW